MSGHEDLSWQLDDEVLDPNLQIVDSHLHLWDDGRGRFGLDELRANASLGHQVSDIVFVECNWWDTAQAEDPLAPVQEIRNVVDLAEQADALGGVRVAAIVGFADLRFGANIGETLDAMTEVGAGRFVGIRHPTGWDTDPEIGEALTHPGPHLLADKTFRAGVAELARRDLVFDAWAYHPQLPEVAAIAREFPGAKIVVNHLGGPLHAGSYAAHPEEVDAQWRAGLLEIAACPNTRLKIGGVGIGRVSGTWRQPHTSVEIAERWGEPIRWTIETFGAERCMFESNFPVDAALGSYHTVWNAYKLIVADASPAEKQALFSGTARAAYLERTRQ